MSICNLQAYLKNELLKYVVDKRKFIIRYLDWKWTQHQS
jgi:hypothetical protein